MRRLFALRDARLLLAGQLFSLFGDSALFLMLGIWVKSLTGSNGAAGLVFFFLALPSIVAPLAGFVVDRLPRRPLMMGTNLFIGTAVLLLLLVHGRDQVWIIYLVAILYGAAGALYYAAQSALLKVMLPDDLLGDANGTLQTSREGLRLIGPLIGAGMFAAFGGGVVAILDALTFAVSIGCLALLHVKEEVRGRGDERIVDEMLAGIRHVIKSTALRDIVLGVAVALLVVGFSETIIFAVTAQGLHRPPTFLGVLSTTQGIGAIAGGLTAAPALRRLGDTKLIGLGLCLFGVGDCLLMASSLPVVIAGLIVAGSGIPWAVVGFGTAIQRRTPAELQGRVYSAADTMVTVPQTISIALGAGMATVVDYRILLAIMSVVVLCSGGFLVSRRYPVATDALTTVAAPAAQTSV